MHPARAAVARVITEQPAARRIRDRRLARPLCIPVLPSTSSTPSACLRGRGRTWGTRIATAFISPKRRKGNRQHSIVPVLRRTLFCALGQRILNRGGVGTAICAVQADD